MTRDALDPLGASRVGAASKKTEKTIGEPTRPGVNHFRPTGQGISLRNEGRHLRRLRDASGRQGSERPPRRGNRPAKAAGRLPLVVQFNKYGDVSAAGGRPGPVD